MPGFFCLYNANFSLIFTGQEIPLIRIELKRGTRTMKVFWQHLWSDCNCILIFFHATKRCQGSSSSVIRLKTDYNLGNV